jgi:hypothetical protein
VLQILLINSCTVELFSLKNRDLYLIFFLFVSLYFHRVIADIESRIKLVQFSIPLIGGAYLGAVSLVVMIYSIMDSYIARLSQWGGEGVPLLRQIVSICIRSGNRRGRGGGDSTLSAYFKLVGFGRACAPVRCAHLSFWVH